MTDDRSTFDSPLIDLLRYKWTLPILAVLSEGEHRFNELQRAVGDAPGNVLSERLKQLEEETVVSRSVEATSPPRVTYELTDRGEDLARAVEEIERL